MTLSRTFVRDDETEIEVEFTYSPGLPETGPSYACGGEPAEPPEIEITAAWADGVDLYTDFSDAELERLEEEIANDPPEDDYPDEPEWRDEP